MVQHPNVYAELLGEKIAKHNVRCWLVNTGWTGGPHGEGHRISIRYTRAMINAALNEELEQVEYTQDSVFGIQVPSSCPGVPDEVLQPRGTWGDPQAYDQQAQQLAEMFLDNFKQFEDEVPESVKAAAPVVE
jgi:phosphoenolpyruvate carboxykinase (ATP)